MNQIIQQKNGDLLGGLLLCYYGITTVKKMIKYDEIKNIIKIIEQCIAVAIKFYKKKGNRTSKILISKHGKGEKFEEELYSLKEISKINVLLTEIKINKKKPFNSAIKLNINEKKYLNRVIILVDDVVNSGKTMIYGVKHFLNAPVKKITTTALIDRKHLRFPIRTDFAGLVLSTSIKEHVAVELGENEAVYVE